MKIDHIGYAVKNIDKARKSMEALGYVFEKTVDDIDRNIFIAFGEIDGYRVELVAPKNLSGGGTPVDGVLGKIGPTPYHICYRCHDLDATCRELVSQGYVICDEKHSAVAFDDRSVCFLIHPFMGMIELLEE